MSFVSRNHPQQIAVRGALVDVDDRATTPELFAPLDARFGFTVDVAATALNAKCLRFYTVAEDGLRQSWADEVVWCNPPFSSIEPWVAKAWTEAATAKAIVMIVPANRTEQGWWQDLVEPFRDRGGSMLSVEFLRGRLRFIQAGRYGVGPNERPPFGCCLLIWQRLRP